MFECPVCICTDLIELGTLGHLTHYRCRDCGLTLTGCCDCGDDGEDPSPHCQTCYGSGVVEAK